jgi:hypothetical protein
MNVFCAVSFSTILAGLTAVSGSSSISRLPCSLLLLELLAGLCVWLSLGNLLRKTGYGNLWRNAASTTAISSRSSLPRSEIPRILHTPSTHPITGAPASTTGSLATAPATVTLTPRSSAIGRGGSGTLVLIIVLLSGVLGWTVRDMQLRVPSRQYWDVMVTGRHSPREYQLSFPGSGRMNITTCHDVDWQAGEKMQTLAYIQRIGCKDVTINGWYKFYAEPDGTRAKFNLNEEVANAY